MKAILLAAGYGTRLRPLTEKVPKCLVPLAGEPLLKIWIEKLQNVGVEEIIINSHYLHGAVLDFLAELDCEAKITLDFEPVLLGTAGTLRKHLSVTKGEELLLIHADNYLHEGLERFIESHMARPSRAVMSMLTFETDEPSSCGIIKIDDSGILQNFYEKPVIDLGRQANGAIYLLTQEFLQLFSEMGAVVDFSRDVLPEFIGRVFTVKASGPLIDIGTPARYSVASALRRESRVTS